MATSRGFIGAGEIYLNQIVSGVKQGITGPYYANKFEIKPNLKKVELKSFARATYGQTLEDVSVQEPATFTMELSENTKAALAMAFFGTPSDVSQSAGTLTAVAIAADLDEWVPLTKAALTGSPTVTNNAGSTTYTQGVDYEVNAQMGWVKALLGGAIVDGQTIKVTTTYGAFTGTKYAGVTKSDIRAEIIFVGINLADQTPCIVRVHEGIIVADQAIDFLSENFYATTLPGTMRMPTGATEQFTIETRTA